MVEPSKAMVAQEECAAGAVRRVLQQPVSCKGFWGLPDPQLVAPPLHSGGPERFSDSVLQVETGGCCSSSRVAYSWGQGANSDHMQPIGSCCTGKGV